MDLSKKAERPLGVYLVTLYFVLSGFLEAIQKYREWGSAFIWNPLAAHSIWHIAADVTLYLAIAYMVWHMTWLGRLAGLVFGYLYLGTWSWFLILYSRGTAMNATTLHLILAGYHILALPFLLYYLQTEPRKRLFRQSLLAILLPHD